MNLLILLYFIWYTQLLSVTIDSKSRGHFFHEINPVFGGISQIDQLDLYCRDQSEISENGQRTDYAVQVVVTEIFRCLFHELIGIDADMGGHVWHDGISRQVNFRAGVRSRSRRVAGYFM